MSDSQAPAKSDKSDKTAKEEELSEEDQRLKEDLELCVVRLCESDDSLWAAALQSLSDLLCSATSSLTSVPKPLKFLRPHCDTLRARFDEWPLSQPLRKPLADVLSVLCMVRVSTPTTAAAASAATAANNTDATATTATAAATAAAAVEEEALPQRLVLKYKLQGNRHELSKWGYEYVRALSGEIAAEYAFRQQSGDEGDDGEVFVDDLLSLIDDIVPFQMSHNAEVDACDLLLETQQLPRLLTLSVVRAGDERTCERVCAYLCKSAAFLGDPDDLRAALRTALALWRGQSRWCEALAVALRLGGTEGDAEARALFATEGLTTAQRRQLALLLARHKSYLLGSGDTEFTASDGLEREVALAGNTHLAEQFVAVAAAMDVTAPKPPEDIFKNDQKKKSSTANIDSLKANVASTYVNGFANAGFGDDALLSSESSDWVFKNKNQGALAAAASLGLINLWNVEEGMNKVDKFFHSNDEFLRAGACLAVGLAACTVRHESDPAMALLAEYLDESAQSTCRTASLLGLGIAYAGQRREEVRDMIEPLLLSESVPIADASFAALALGMIFAGSGHDDLCSSMLQRFMESTDTDLDQGVSRFLALGLALLFIGQGEKSEATLEAVRTISHRRGKYAEVALQSVAYAGTGDVLQVQSLLRLCTEHIADQKDAEYQMVAVLGLAVVALGEDVGSEMTQRTFEHLLHYGELPIRRSVPIALALLYASNPEYGVVDQFSRLSHDADAQLAMNAILGLGLSSAGTNNSRVANILRQLAEFHAKDANLLFCVRLAQGLNSMGKGLLSVSPLHSDRQLLSPTSLAALLTFAHSCLDLQHTFLDNLHYLIFLVAPAISPRYLVTVDEDLSIVKASARVGMAVETVGLAGRPKTITGFQTHTTPVLLNFKDRAELAGSEYKSIASVVEGTVLVTKVETQQL